MPTVRMTPEDATGLRTRWGLKLAELAPTRSDSRKAADMDLGIAGRTALVCASTSGLGLATSAALAHDGAETVVVTGRSEARVRRDAAAGLPRAVGIAVDLVEEGGAEQLCAGPRVEQVGEPDILVLNGPGPASPAPPPTSVDGARTAFATLVTPHHALVSHVLPGMRDTSAGVGSSAVGSSGVVAPLPGPRRCPTPGARHWPATSRPSPPRWRLDAVTVNMLLPGRIATDRVAELATQAAAKPRHARARRSRLEVPQAPSPPAATADPAEFGAAAAFLCSAPAGTSRAWCCGATAACCRLPRRGSGRPSRIRAPLPPVSPFPIDVSGVTLNPHSEQ